MKRIPTDAEWVHSRVATLPKRWEERLTRAWEAKHPIDYYGANVDLRETTEALLRVRIPLDASDASVCEAAAALANRCASRAEIFHAADSLRAAMERICMGQGIEAPSTKVKHGPAMARMCCPQWWREKLRRHHARTVEAAAIRTGYVSKAGDLYVSNEGLRSRVQQNTRNQATLEATVARNDAGQEFTLAELAATSPSNKAVKRAELMTRISGFERIARQNADSGLFATLTCPSRFHRFRTVNNGKKVVSNPNYAPSETPETGQKYLAKVWAHIRSDLQNHGITVYGFRIAEPQHDGTPHWHFLIFFRQDAAEIVRETMAKHALRDSPNEPGASEHRCDFKPIDWRKGSAAGYVAKYVSKNIDGYGVGDDLNGKPASETAARVEAWASIWGIRQFQQLGGPPVGPWREMRRIKKLPAGAPAHLKQAHDAVNKVAILDGRDKASVAWDQYCMAQGGATCGRAASIKLVMKIPEKLGRYGDKATPRPYGIETTSLETYSVEGKPGVTVPRTVHWIVESERHDWEIARSPKKVAASGVSFAKRAQPAKPWTSVNNCTARPAIKITASSIFLAPSQSVHMSGIFKEI